MIDDLVFKTNHLGKDGFIWWIGQVARKESWINEKSKPGNSERCRVRIIGYHPFKKGELPDEHLPLAHIMMSPVLGSGQGGEGMNSTITGGEVCFGFFLDGDDAQQPIIVGLMSRNELVKNGELDSEFEFQPFSGLGPNPPSTKTPAAPAAPGAGTTAAAGVGTTAAAGVGTTAAAGVGTTAAAPGAGTTAAAPGAGTTAGGAAAEPPATPAAAGPTLNSNFYRGLDPSLQLSIPPFNSELFELIKQKSEGVFPGDSNAAVRAFEHAARLGTIIPPDPCKKNFIGQITSYLKDFIEIISVVKKYADVYIDPVLNEVVDIARTIRSTAGLIGGIIKSIINSLRNAIIKCVVSITKKLLSGLPDTIKTIFSQAIQNILNIIFCLFEKVGLLILDFIINLLTKMVDSVISAPLCALDQLVTAILTKVMDTIDSALEPVISGVSWLSGAISSVFNILNSVSSIASQIYNFIGCDDLKCTTPSMWVKGLYPSQMKTDNWQKTVDSVNIFKGIEDGLQSIDDAINELSLFDKSSKYDSCNRRVNNPRNQSEVTRPGPCLPPEIIIFDGGVGMGANLKPIVSSKRVVAVEIISGGFGFIDTPELYVVDNTGNGRNAKLKAKLNDKGEIQDVIVLDTGNGYCSDATIESDTEDALINITSDKERIYEGESVEFTITSSNNTDDQELSYSITGIESKFIKQAPTGTLLLTGGVVKIKIDTISDDIVNTKTLKLNIIQYNKNKEIIVEDFSENPINKNSEYKLTSNRYNINEGTTFKITLETTNIPDKTKVPFIISDVEPRLIENYETYKDFEIKNNKAEITFTTISNVMQSESQLFKLKLKNEKASIGILINRIRGNTQPDSNPVEPSLCLVGFELLKPGYGYSTTDTLTDGVYNYQLIISPDTGSIFGARPLPNNICGYKFPPVLSINTFTGVGAALAPIMRPDPNNTQSILNWIGNKNDAEIIKLIDCI